MSRIGIDVGGTNTDAVLLEDGKVLAAVKSPTTVDVADGVRQALADLLAAAACLPAVGRIEAVMIGTTHFTNAVVERSHLDRVAALRIGLPANAGLPPFIGWPKDLAGVMRGSTHMVRGGHERADIDPGDDEPGLSRMAERVRRRQDDDRATGSPDASLRHRRDRQR